ncbi:MAG: ribonuclease R, partial [bacterium]
MEISSKKILAAIKKQSSHPMKMKELAKALNIPQNLYTQFRIVVKSLIVTGDLIKLKRGRIGLPEEMDMIIGEISLTRKGVGFVPVESEEEDILIPPLSLGTALDGDKVMVRLTGMSAGRQAGVVVKVVERSGRNIVGIFHVGQHFAYVSPDNVRIHRDIYIPAAEVNEAKEGQKVVCKLIEWEDSNQNPVGKVTDVLGFPEDPGVDLLTVIKNFNLPEEFPQNVLNEAELQTSKNIDDELSNRLDLSNECIYTIDPFDAKDHDDAISIEKDKNGYKLGVHIADVSFWVEPGTELDKEAFLRGNSVYLPGKVIPMLPEILSNDVCSLKPNRKRLAFSIFINFDLKGNMLSWKLADSVIKSQAKLAYEEVQDFYDNKELKPQTQSKIKKTANSLTLARELASILSNKRFAEGSLDFDLPESKIILNDKGEVLELGNKVRLESHRLVEEFMLVANKAVALEVFRKGQQMIYRVHDRPDKEKLENFSAMMSRLGYKFPVSDNTKPNDLARFLIKVKGKPEEEFINELMLRSLQKAVYQRKNIGHFGLAFKHYSHFTSPIRRYPDLLVHRLLRASKDGKYPPEFAKRIPAIIDNVGKHCSDTERLAEKAEREAIKIKQASYMAKHVGDVFKGVISGVMPFGFYVRLDGLGAEGMVRVSTIDDDYYHHDEKNYSLIG